MVADVSAVLTPDAAEARRTSTRLQRVGGDGHKVGGARDRVSGMSPTGREFAGGLAKDASGRTVHFPCLIGTDLLNTFFFFLLRHKFTLYLGVDACFRLKRRLVSNELKDPGLGNGWAYMVEDTEYQKYLLDVTDQKEVRVRASYR